MSQSDAVTTGPTWVATRTITADTQSQPGSPLYLARRIAGNLRLLFGFNPETATARRTDLNADQVPHLMEIEYSVSGHRVIVASTPNRTTARMPAHTGLRDYTLTVDETPVPYPTTLLRPVAELLAEAAHHAITAPQPPATGRA